MDNIRINVKKNGKTLLFSFLGTSIPLMEHIAVIDYEDLHSLISDTNITRSTSYVFLIIEKGEAELEINGLKKVVGRNELVCSIPGESIVWKKINNLSGKFIFFDGPFLTAVLKGAFTLEPVSYLNSNYHYPYIKLSEKKYRKLLYLTNEMIETLEEKPIFYDLLRVQLWQFVFLTEKEYISNQNMERRKPNSSNHISNFIALVEKNFEVAHDAKFYADKMNITPNYLNKIIKEALGISAYGYILNRIVSEAKVLLRLTDISIKELANRLGFDDTGYFIRCFKKVEDITPTEYRSKGSL